MLGNPLLGASAVNLVKGVSVKGEQCEIVSDTMESLLNIPCRALMGANVAKENCESGIAFTDAARTEVYPAFHCKTSALS